MKQRYVIGTVLALSGLWWLLNFSPQPAHAQGPATPPPLPPPPTAIPLAGYEQAVSRANAQAQAAGSQLAQAQAEYAQAKALAAQANARLAEAKQARDQQLLEQAVTLATQAKDLADQSAGKVTLAEHLMGDAQAQLAEQSARNVALLSDLNTLQVQLAGSTDQLAAVQRYADDLRGQIRRTDQQVNTLIRWLSFSLGVAAVMALVMMRRTHQVQELLRGMATITQPPPAPPPTPSPAPVIDEQGTLLYEETDVDEELSLLLADVFRASASPSQA
jgi:hypothetical protein